MKPAAYAVTICKRQKICHIVVLAAAAKSTLTASVVALSTIKVIGNL